MPALRGFDRQITRHLIERSRYGQHDRLFFQPIVRLIACHRLIPALPHMPQIAGRRFHRRDASHVRRGAPGQQRSRAIDSRMAEPGFRTGHEPARDPRP